MWTWRQKAAQNGCGSWVWVFFSSVEIIIKELGLDVLVFFWLNKKRY